MENLDDAPDGHHSWTTTGPLTHKPGIRVSRAGDPDRTPVYEVYLEIEWICSCADCDAMERKEITLGYLDGASLLDAVSPEKFDVAAWMQDRPGGDPTE